MKLEEDLKNARALVTELMDRISELGLRHARVVKQLEAADAVCCLAERMHIDGLSDSETEYDDWLEMPDALQAWRESKRRG